MGKLIIASNRLPVTVKLIDGEFVLLPSTGGLATGLAGLLTSQESIWVGWHGCSDPLDADQEERLTAELRSRRLYSIHLSEADIQGYYNDVSNGALWPLYHYQTERMPLSLHGWHEYCQVNERFCEEIATQYQEGDDIWIHDYHLQLLPALLRERLPNARIGFFLHIPFPSSEIFRILPWRRQILEGLLGADVIGFHTHAYARHFKSALLRVLGIDAYADQIMVGGRSTKIGAFPLGIDVSQIALRADEAQCELASALKAMKSEGRAQHLMLAIDRLDYTKGLPRRLLALENLLENSPELRGEVVLVQIAAPSRDDVPAYESYRREVEGLVGRINGRFGMPGYQPIHYVSRSFSQDEILALYKHVDVMVVTPLRDGMNLVAKEFVATRDDLDSVLVLSEFAGAAAELGEAVHVNPYDIADSAAGMLTAIKMPADERKARMKALRERVVQFDASAWVQRFVAFLHDNVDDGKTVHHLQPTELIEHVPSRERKVLFLDYDGTLFPIVRMPQLAKPDGPLLSLLHLLTENDLYEVHIVSGRSSDVLDGWFLGNSIHLHAEHGALSRSAGQKTWTSAVAHGSDWKGFVRSVLEDFTKNTPGSFIEEKIHSLAWHYRMSDPVHGERAANELKLHARETFAPMGLELVSGKRVIEVRHAGINKGIIVKRTMELHDVNDIAIAIGDDMTDEDMFSAVAPNGISVVVGDQPSKAKFRLRDPAAVRRFLELLVSSARQNTR